MDVSGWGVLKAADPDGTTPSRGHEPGLRGPTGRPAGFRWLTLACLIPLALAVALAVSPVGEALRMPWWLLGVASAATLPLFAVAWNHRRHTDSGRSLRAWTLLSVASVLLNLGVVAVATGLMDPHAGLHVGYLVASPFFAVAVLVLPTPPLRDRWEATLDVLDGVTAALGMAVISLWLLPDDPSLSFGVEEWTHVVATTGTVGVLVYVVTRQRRPGGVPLRQVELVLLAATLVTVGSVLAYRGLVGGLDWLFLASAALLVLGCAVGAQAVVRDPHEVEGAPEAVRREAWATYLPVVPVGIALVALAWYAARPDPLPGMLGVPMVVLVFVLVIAFLAVRVLLEQQARRLRSQAGQYEVESVVQAAWFRSMTADASDAMVLIDRLGCIVVSSPSVERMLGWSPNSLTGVRLTDLVNVTDSEWQTVVSRISYGAGSEVLSDVTVRTAEGDRLADLRISPLEGGSGLPGFVVTLRDETERRDLSRALAEQQHTDSLTGLRNRAGFIAEAASHVSQGGSAAVVVLDLKRFGLVNDARGHDAGDDLLRRAGGMVESCAACGGVVVGRVGGDEFAVVLAAADGDVDERVRASAAHLAGTLGELADLRGDGLPLASHIGYAVADVPGLQADELLRRAEVAAEAARSLGADEPVRFDADRRAARLAEVGLEAELRTAISTEQLVLHYQPVVDIHDGRPVGVEALVRWLHPVRGLLAPDRFVPLAERCGLAPDLGRWVMRQALTDQPALATAAGTGRFRVAVNISAQQITTGLSGEIADALDGAGVAASDLVVEVTESALFTRPDEAGPTLQALRDLGVSVALDDFGTGYSSLALLTRVPVDVLKVDRGFVDRVEEHGHEWALVRGVLGLCQSLRLRSVVEGIERDSQASLLRAMGADEAQGYLFARPLPLADACAWLRDHAAGSSTLPG